MKRKLFIIDAYNVIGSWPKLSELKFQNKLTEARNLLLRILSDFQDYNKLDILVVFDAMYIPTPEQKGNYHNLKIVWTKRDETADSYIEALVRRIHEHQKYFIQPVVVTNDDAEQWTVFEAGALRMPDSELLGEIQSSNIDIKHKVKHYQTKSRIRRVPWNQKQIKKLSQLRGKLSNNYNKDKNRKDDYHGKDKP